MKNFIYFSLIIGLLASCKSSSFLKQRYTHLGHTVTKSTTPPGKSKPATKQDVAIKSSVAASPHIIADAAVAVNIESLPEQNTAPAEQKKNSAHAKPLEFKNKKLQALYENVNVLKLSTKKEIGSDSKKFNSEHKSVTAAMGIIKKVLKIIILILVLAIVVSLIILASTLKA